MFKKVLLPIFFLTTNLQASFIDGLYNWIFGNEKQQETQLSFQTKSPQNLISKEEKQEQLEQKIRKLIKSDDSIALDTLLNKIDLETKKNLLSKKITVESLEENPFITNFLNLAVNFNCYKVTGILIKHGSSINECANDGFSPLSRAADDNSQNMIEQLIKFGADINSYDANGKTALHIAITKSHIDLISFLIKFGAKINLATKNGVAPIFIAVYNNNIKAAEALIKHGANIKTSNRDGFSPLTSAAYHNLPQMIELLVKHGAKINDYDENGNTALYVATYKFHTDLIPLLIKLGANINKATKKGFPPLFNSIQNKNIEMVETLIKNGANINLSDKDRFSPLTSAAYYNLPQTIELLVKHGAKINDYDKNGNTALYVATYKFHTDLIPLLIKLGANINKATKKGFPPLFNSIQNKNIEMIKALIKHGANINLSDKDGFSPLTFAAYHNLPQMIELLVKHGAKINDYDKNGNTALYVATYKFHTDLIPLLIKLGANINKANKDGYLPLFNSIQNKNIEMVETLIKNGANINLSDKDRFSPLTSAAYHNLPQTIELLIKLGSDINACDASGKTPLCMAAQRSNTEAVKMLIELGANVNLATRNGFFPIHNALNQNNQQIIEILLEHNANTNVKDPDGNTALHIAIENSYDNIAQLLINHNANESLKNDNLINPITLAAFYNKKNLVKTMLKNRDPSLQELRKTILFNNINAFKMLLEFCKTDLFEDKSNKSYINWHILTIGNQDFINICQTNTKDFLNKSIYGLYPLQIAAIYGHEELVRYFIEQCHATVNIADNYGLTPLHYAVLYNNYEITEYLIKKKCLINAQTLKDFYNIKEKSTPCDIAIQFGYQDVLDLLVKNGATINKYIQNPRFDQSSYLTLFIDLNNECTKPNQQLVSVQTALSEKIWYLIKQKACPIIIIGQHLLYNALQLSCSINNWITIDISYENINGYILIPPKIIRFPADNNYASLDSNLQTIGLDLSSIKHSYTNESCVREKQPIYSDIQTANFSKLVPLIIDKLLIPKERYVFLSGHGWAKDPSTIGCLLNDDALNLLTILANKKTKIIYLSSCFFGGKNFETVKNFNDIPIISAATTEIIVRGNIDLMPNNWHSFFNALNTYYNFSNNNQFCEYLSNQALQFFVTQKPNLSNFPHIKFPGTQFALLPINNQAMSIDKETLSKSKILEVENKRLLEVNIEKINNTITIKDKIPLIISNSKKNTFEKINIETIKKAQNKDLIYVIRKFTKPDIFKDSTLKNILLIKELKLQEKLPIDNQNNKTNIYNTLYNVVIERGPSSECYTIFGTDKNPTITSSNCIAYDDATAQWVSLDPIPKDTFNMYLQELN